MTIFFVFLTTLAWVGLVTAKFMGLDISWFFALLPLILQVSGISIFLFLEGVGLNFDFDES